MVSVICNRRHFLAGAVGTTLGSRAFVLRIGERDMSKDGVFELRQYTLRRGQRDTLISLFENALVEPQNEVGAHVVGTFRDLDDPDRFVWIRGFRDMPARQRALGSFYGGPVWRANRSAANETMLDSDNVLLLRTVGRGQGFAPQSASRSGADSVIGATIYYLGSTDATQFMQFFEQAVLPHLVAAGVQPIACLVTEEAPNNYPRLPVREHDRTFIWFARWADSAAETAFVSRFCSLGGWRDSAPQAVLPALMRKPERLRLLPTSRSALR